MKLVESQLLASLAAANARSDAAVLRSQRLAAVLEATAAKQAAAAAAGRPALDDEGGERDRHEEGTATRLARMTAQAAAQSQEVYRLQDQLLQAKQVWLGWGS